MTTPANSSTSKKSRKSSETLVPRADIDRCGELIDWYQANKPKLDELKSLKEGIREKCAAKPADAPVRLEGDRYYLDLGMRENERSIRDKKKAFAALKKAMGYTALLEALTYTLKLMEKWLSPEELATHLTQDRTGSREFAAVLKTAAIAA